MIDWIIVAACAAFTIFGPIVRRGGNYAWHNVLVTQLPLDSTMLQQGQHPEGIRAQEIGEDRSAGIVGVIAAGVAAWLLDGNAALFATPLAFFIVKVICFKLPFWDWAGHGAEIAVAESDGYWTYRDEEIARMLRDAGYQGLTAEDVGRRIDRMAWLSKIMVKLAW